MNIYYLDDDMLEKIRKISEKLHNMNDDARDQGHKLWLVINDIESTKTEME